MTEIQREQAGPGQATQPQRTPQQPDPTREQYPGRETQEHPQREQDEQEIEEDQQDDLIDE